MTILPGTDVNQAIASVLSDEMPLPEAVAPTPGAAPKARRADARQARLTSSTKHVTTAGGTTRVMFTRKFTREPFMVGTLLEAANNGPSDCKVLKFVTAAGADWNAAADQSVDANQIAGADIYWYRIRAMPTLNLGGIVLIGPLLTALGALSAYEPYVAVAGGVTFLAIAVASSEA